MSQNDQLHDTTASFEAEPEHEPEEHSDDTRLNDGKGLSIAKPEDFNVRRGEDGTLLPVKQRIPGTDKAIKVKPVSGGAREEYADVLSGQSDDPEQVAALWQEHIVEGVGADATPTDIEKVYPYGLIAGINQALKNSAGEDLFLAVREQQNEEMQANMEMLDALGDEVVESMLAEVMDEESGTDSAAPGPEHS